jgi:Ca2+-transporting ATPase
MLSTNFSEIEVMLAAIALGLGSPLNPMQLLWINLLTDIFPGLALALEAPEPDIMNRPPRDPDEPIIRRRDLKRMGVESGVITAGTLAAFVWGLLRYGPGARASGLAFNTLTTAQLLHALLCRSEHAGLRQPGRRPNRYLDAALGLSLAAQVSVLLFPPLRRLLGVGRVGWLDLPVMAAGSLGPLLLNDWLKRHSTSHPTPGAKESHHVH